jgi:Glycosyl hydrolase family 95 catalytic domain
MNFWWDYLYSGDVEFLREVTYPLLRMVADYFVSDLVLEADQRYHCVKSGSPEQSNTARDNIYDWALLNYLFRACIRASETLVIDDQLRSRWREILGALFTPPGDGNTLRETPDVPHPYRCHPVVLFGLYPTNAIAHGSDLFMKTRRTLDIVTRLIGYRYEDRHETIPGFEGGMESNGFSSGIVTTAAARLGDRESYRRFLYGLIVRFHMKQNGLRALLDTRQSSDIARASLVEAASAQTVATAETLVQSWDDTVRVFPCVGDEGRYRFAGLRAAGGFVLSGEAQEGRLRWIRVNSLTGGALRLSSPLLRDIVARDTASGRAVPFKWVHGTQEDRALQLECKAGATYHLLAGEQVKVDLELAPAPLRDQPRSISIRDVEAYGSHFVHYPEDLPFGQVVSDENLYLGRPGQYGRVAALPKLQDLLVKAVGRSWQERQDAARLMARLQPTREILGALDRLCSDSMTVVAHTAAVTLVHLKTPEALSIAQAHAEKDAIPGLKREVEKARRRLQYRK